MIKRANNKAFTLIEVITTITILSIIMAIAVGSIDGLVQTSKKKAMLASANNYVDAINLGVVMDDVENDHQVIEGSKYQSYIDSENPLDKYSDVVVSNGKIEKANFCFKDGLVTYNDGVYQTYLNDDCQQKVFSDTVINAYGVDKNNKTDGVPVFTGEKAEQITDKIGYEEASHKLYMTNEGVSSGNIENEVQTDFCDVNNKNCDYRCINGTLNYDEKGNIIKKTNCRYGSAGIRLASIALKQLPISWSMAMGYSVESYFGLRQRTDEYRNSSIKYLDYITSSDGLESNIYNPYLYKSFCDSNTYVNSEIIYNYCNNIQTNNRVVGSANNYLKTKHILMNGLYPYLQQDFSVRTSDTIQKDAILDKEKVKYDVKEYIKYGAVDFTDTQNKDSNIQQKISNIKKILSKYSGVVILTAYGENFEFYDKDKNIIYQQVSNKKAETEHAVTIVGWDDEKEISGKRGAWIAIVSNGSYASKPDEAANNGVNKNGFTYVSYYDYGYLSNEHYAFINIENADNKNKRTYSVYNSSYEQIQGTTSPKLKSIVGKDYATNLVFDRIDSKNYTETIDEIKIYNQFSLQTAYKVYLKQNDVYREIAFVHFNKNESGFKTVKLNNNIVLKDEKIDLVITIASDVSINNLTFLPEDLTLVTKTSSTEEIDIKVFDVEESIDETGFTIVNFSILTNNIPTGDKIEFTGITWNDKLTTLGGASATVINNYATASVQVANRQKTEIKVNYNGEEIALNDKIIVNASYDTYPVCSFSQSKITLQKERNILITLTCKDDVGIQSKKLYSGLFGDLSIANTYYAKINSISSPSCNNKECTWKVQIEAKNHSGKTTLKLATGSVTDIKNQGNRAITAEVVVN